MKLTKYRKLLLNILGTLFVILSALCFFWDKLFSQKEFDDHKENVDNRFDTISKESTEFKKKLKKDSIKVDSSLADFDNQLKINEDELSRVKDQSSESLERLEELDERTEETNYHAKNHSFFQENNFDLPRLHKIFRLGYHVYQQNEDIDRPFKKVFGNKIYTDLSKFYIKEEDGVHHYYYSYEYVEGYFNNNSIMENNLEISVIDMENTSSVHVFQGIGMGIEHQNTWYLNGVLVIKNTEPYIFAVGLTANQF